ncbi:hypothetical protein [Streptomyces sp. NL15-2K]|uniref:hypothetical protein n=1 Tax=Streptomyces sp. NL15-2K TaxID=376149 RepID=UPI000F567742|nr:MULTISPECIES: hypothetical protein [Actinomycetes]WKX14890.1 hypothetical protein Q4V64_48310 [Kutzneria buriramensis]GCB51822.1 hypothetical protein SNL152K_9178 [Streptomyces sp. NL15-2K]
MLTRTANGDSRLSLWQRVREFAVPPSMIETATSRRLAGDWAGACAAAGIDVDLSLRSLARTHGQALVAQLRADLRHLAPDLLRWHMPRIGPDGLLRPGLTVSLARYDAVGRDGAGPVHLVVRTPPAWADAGQRISLALWDGSASGPDARRHPHPRPNRRFRLDLHRHLWDARRTDELRIRSGADLPADSPAPPPDPLGSVPQGSRCAVDRWAAEAGILLHAEGRTGGAVAVRVGARQRLVLRLIADENGTGPPELRITAAPTRGDASAPPVLPDAATWVLPDLELIRAGLIEVDRLHPLVASALAPDHSPAGRSRAPDPTGPARLVECRGAQHRIGLVDGVLAPLDHDPTEIRREELLAALTGTPLPCLQAIDAAHRHPECLADVRARLDHGDIAGALAVVEALLGPDALLRGGALRDELEAAAQRRITYGLFRAGLTGPGPARLRPEDRRRPRIGRSRPRHGTFR